MSTSPAARRRTRIRALLRWGPLVLGVLLFVGALYYINLALTLETVQRLGVGLPLALLFSGIWHAARTWAWAWCFPHPGQVSFLRLARVRLSAEAFSYLTVRGIAGEPLKVVLLSDRVDAREATAAVALERLAYIVGTVIIVGIGSLGAIVGLPLTRGWFRVFRAFAIAAAVMTTMAIVVITGKGNYVEALLRRIDGTFRSSVTTGRVGRFVIAVERLMLDLVRGNPLRLGVLLGTTVASYLLMALEAWVLLRASGVEISANAAVAVETFSRVASFASAFIPANLGALEASSLAAVAAVGAAGGGAALALGRRIRGLFWAGIGLAIYPRGSRPSVRASDDRDCGRSRHPRATLLYLPFDPEVRVDPRTRVAGLSIAERVIRAAGRAGFDRVVIWLPRSAGATFEAAIRSAVATAGGDVILATTRAEWNEAIRMSTTLVPMTAIGGGTVVSPALFAAAQQVSAASGEYRDVPAGPAWPQSGVLRVSAVDACDVTRLQAALARRRRRACPLPSGADVSNGAAMLAMRIVQPGDIPAAEAIIRRSSYKGTDGMLARFNRRMSVPISVALIRTPLTANQLSVGLVALGFYSAWLFSLGHYWTGALGALISLAASVLDGCDGEIARLKYQESALGCWIETFGDYSYYLAIFAGLSVGAVRQTHAPIFYWLGGAAIAGSLLTFALLLYLRKRITNGQPERLHAIARDRVRSEQSPGSSLILKLSFVATRAAMPYGILAFAILNILPAIVVLAAIGSNVYWISLIVRLPRLLGDSVGIRDQGAAVEVLEFRS
jgi:phosphatidylglycerophosphate synthase